MENGAQAAQTTVVKPTNGANGAQAPVQQTAPDPVADAKKVLADAEAKLQAAEKRARIHAIEARKFADEKKGIGAKLSEYEKLTKWKAEQERLDSQAKLNKAAFLRAKFGDDWYDQIVQEKLNGGAPTADTVALEVARVEEKLEKKFQEREEERIKAQQEAQNREIQAELRAFAGRAVDFVKTNLKDYPIFKKLGSEEAIGNQLVQIIRNEHDRTIQRDQETGAVLSPGHVLSLKEAADALEAYHVGVAEEAAAHEKYKSKLTEKLKPAGLPVTGAPQLRRTEGERRTLSNDLTATTTGRKPVQSDDERRERAIAAYAAARSKAST